MITTSTSVRGAIDGMALSSVTRTGVAGAARTLTREAAADRITRHNVLAAPILTDRGACLASNRAAFITGVAVFIAGGGRRVVG